MIIKNISTLLFFFFFYFSSFSHDVQWACRIIETSERSQGEWFSVKEVLGVPNVFPSGPKENGYGWIMDLNNPEKMAQHIFVTVGFCKNIVAKQIAIVENFNPGSITEVYTINEEGKETRVYAALPKKLEKEGRILNIFFPNQNQIIAAVRIVADPRNVEGRNSIDAVGISDSYALINTEINLAKDMNFVSNALPLSENVNSIYQDKFPKISPDGLTLYFDREGHPRNIVSSKDDIWFSEKGEKGEWTKAKNIGKPLNNEGYNFVSSITPDGNTLLLGNTYNIDGSQLGGGASITHRIKQGWSKPKNLQIQEFKNRNKYSTYFLANDGKTLLLNIEDDNSNGDLDLYVSFLNPDSTWSKPLNLGTDINTLEGEATPVLASDGKTLYFASKGHLGYGGYDIFMTKRLDDSWQKWSKPLNLGPKVNSNSGDLGFSLTASGKYAYLYSWNTDKQKSDIYVIELAESVMPDPVVLIKGKVFNSKTKQPIEANIHYEILPEGVDAGKARSNPENGEYKIVLPAGKNYGYFAQTEGYLSLHQYLEVPKGFEYKEVIQDLYLAPIEVGTAITLNNVFFDQSKAFLLESSFPELDRMVKFLLNNPTIKIEIQGHTDNQGDPSKNVKLSWDRVHSVKNYLISQGVEGNRIRLQGFGGSKPVASNENEETRKLNRRVEFKIISK